MLYIDEDGECYNYTPNELANLSIKNPDKYRTVVESNLEDDDTVEKWEERNLERAKEFLKKK